MPLRKPSISLDPKETPDETLTPELARDSAGMSELLIENPKEAHVLFSSSRHE